MRLKFLNILALSAAVICGGAPMVSCSDDEENIVQETGGFEELPESKDLPFSYENGSQTISFVAKGNWKAVVADGIDWVYFYPASGKKGKNNVKVTVSQNTASSGRTTTLNLVSGDETVAFTVRQPEFGGELPGINQGESGMISPSEIPDYDKFFVNSEWGPTILSKSAKFSFARYKSSEHFFVFWAPEFGDDPNASTVPANMRVDIDDLLAKAEKFFDTNINKLGMATLGQGKSMLDKYKMQIYLLYQEEWLATGSGYDDAIGALWVNPSTCQPVGSTIAHEIGHSFQFQTYADRVQAQGVPNDYKSGFRYGFEGPDGANNGGCVYWEQCAQWQSFQDYPEQQFTSYDYNVWLANCHRHFHHEFHRYASYWLQSYWVAKHGVDAYGKIWTDSRAPEDAIMTYTRLYNGNDYSKTREELFDYAVRMATYDIDGVREYSNGFQNRYTPNFVKNEKGEYQIAYDNCPGATGFNVIPLSVTGSTVKVNFRGLDYGEALAANDKSNIEDGDGNAKGKPTKYNTCGGAENMGWRYGFVALTGNKRTYSEVGKSADGSLSFNVPSGAQQVYLVVQGSPEVYMSHGWDENETNDPQFPYAITLEGARIACYEEPVVPVYNKIDSQNMEVTLNVKLTAPGQYERGKVDLAEKEICSFFGLDANEIGSMIKVGEAPAEGVISCRALNTDGTYNMSASANNGYWLDADGNAGVWGGGYIYFEISGSSLTYGDHPEQIKEGYTGSHTMRPVFVYTKGGRQYTVKYSITLSY